MVTRAPTAVCTAVSSMSGSPTCDTENERKSKRGEFLTPALRHALRAGGVLNDFDQWPSMFLGMTMMRNFPSFSHKFFEQICHVL